MWKMFSNAQLKKFHRTTYLITFSLVSSFVGSLTPQPVFLFQQVKFGKTYLYIIFYIA